jgi:hypothetical protein
MKYCIKDKLIVLWKKSVPTLIHDSVISIKPDFQTENFKFMEEDNFGNAYSLKNCNYSRIC